MIQFLSISTFLRLAQSQLEEGKVVTLYKMLQQQGENFLHTRLCSYVAKFSQFWRNVEIREFLKLSKHHSSTSINLSYSQ